MNYSEFKQSPEDMLRNALETRHAVRLMKRVCARIRDGTLQVGDRIPAERELAKQLGISPASVRMGLGYLAIFGVLSTRQGKGSVVAMSAEELSGSELAANHSGQVGELDCICEARAVLEGNLAALAAERCSHKLRMKLAEELTELFAAADDPQEYLIHEMAFHRILAQAAGNPFLCALMTRITAAIYETHREREVSHGELHNSADRHRMIFHAIRNHKPDEARRTMEDHLRIDGVRCSRCDVRKENPERQAHLICENLHEVCPERAE